MGKPDVSEKFMLVGRIIDLVLDNAEFSRATSRDPGMRRQHYLYTEVSQVQIIKMIEEVYGDGQTLSD